MFLKLAKDAVQEYQTRSGKGSFTTQFRRIWHRIKHKTRTQSDGVLAHSAVEYANLNAIALRKILKKYDKLNESRSGSEIWKTLWSVHDGASSFLHSPLLVKLKSIESIDSLSSTSNSEISTMDHRPRCRLNSNDLKCPICLDVLYNPIALSCGHVYCFSCLLEGYGMHNCVGSLRALLSNIPSEKECFHCRQQRVFRNAEIVPELDYYSRLRNPENWNDRDAAEKEDLARKLNQVKMTRRQVCSNAKFHPSLLLNISWFSFHRSFCQISIVVWFHKCMSQ